jgi:hypothetical protein
MLIAALHEIGIDCVTQGTKQISRYFMNNRELSRNNEILLSRASISGKKRDNAQPSSPSCRSVLTPVFFFWCENYKHVSSRQ